MSLVGKNPEVHIPEYNALPGATGSVHVPPGLPSLRLAETPGMRFARRGSLCYLACMRYALPPVDAILTQHTARQPSVQPKPSVYAVRRRAYQEIPGQNRRARRGINSLRNLLAIQLTTSLSVLHRVYFNTALTQNRFVSNVQQKRVCPSVRTPRLLIVGDGRMAAQWKSGQ